MISEMFIGRKPSHFQINTTVKAFIISESFFWSAWNFITPIFAIFATSHVSGGNVGIAASAYSIHLVFRVMFELISGKILVKSSENQKYLATICGICLITVSYLGFSFTSTIFFLYLFYSISGIGFGIASPAKFSLFSTHLDKNKEIVEWGIYDAVALIGMALAASLGGFIANEYGFRILFLTAASVNLLGAVPFLLFLKTKEEKIISAEVKG